MESQPAQEDHGKNEGVDPNRAYKPPPGYTLVKKSEDAGEFDWDALTKDEHREIWLIRVPDSIKPKYLENLKIEVPPAAVTARVGSLQRKFALFDVWSVGDDNPEQDVGGEEIKSLSCLLPRNKSKKGKLYTIPIARHLVFSAQAATPSTDPSSSSPIIGPFQRPPRESYPPELLNHRFMPYGSLSRDAEDELSAESMEIDDTPAPPPSSPKKAKHHDKPKPDAGMDVDDAKAVSAPQTRAVAAVAAAAAGGKKPKRDKEKKEKAAPGSEKREKEKKTKGKKRKGEDEAPTPTPTPKMKKPKFL